MSLIASCRQRSVYTFPLSFRSILQVITELCLWSITQVSVWGHNISVYGTKNHLIFETILNFVAFIYFEERVKVIPHLAINSILNLSLYSLYYMKLLCKQKWEFPTRNNKNVYSITIFDENLIVIVQINWFLFDVYTFGWIDAFPFYLSFLFCTKILVAGSYSFSILKF
jgi:hypothetical protein